MTTLRLFGWELSVAITGDTRSVTLPLGVGGALVVKHANSASPTLSSPQRVEFFKSGLSITLAIGDLSLKISADGSYEPADGPQSGVALRMGPELPGLQSGWSQFSFGQVVIAPASESYFSFGGASAIGSVTPPTDLITGEYGTVSAPLSVRFDPAGSGLEIDFGQGTADGQVTLAAGALKAQLGVGRPGTLDAGSAAAFLNAPVILSFARIAQTAPTSLRFTQTPDAKPLRLNADLATGAPGIECVTADLLLTFVKPGPNSSVVSVVQDAQLVKRASDGAPLRLRFHGLRNSRNAPEEWTCANPVLLAFRLQRTTGFSTPLLQPATNLALIRAGAFKTPSGKRLPVHAALVGAQVQLQSDVATLRNDTGAERQSPLPAGAGGASPEWRASTLQWLRSRPWLMFGQAAFLHARPGDAYLESAAEDVAWRFNSMPQSAGGLPVIPRNHWNETAGAPSAGKLREVNREVDLSFGGMALQDRVAEHESGLTDKTADPTGNGVLVPPPKIASVMPPPDAGPGPSLILHAHPRTLSIEKPDLASIGTLDLTIAVGAGQSIDYAICWPQQIAVMSGWRPTFSADLLGGSLAGSIDPGVPIRIGSSAGGQGDFPTAILKISRTESLAQILNDMAGQLSGASQTTFLALVKTRIDLITEVDPAVLGASWVGLVVFDAALDLSQFATLQAMVPTNTADSPKLDFVAIYPRDPGSANAGAPISAAINWSRPGVPPAPNYDAPGGGDTSSFEAGFWPQALKVAFRARRLTQFYASATLQFRSFLGLAGGNPVCVEIVGSAHAVAGRSDSYDIRFAANLTEPLQVFPTSGSSPGISFVDQVLLSGVQLAEVTGSGSGVQIQINGQVKFKAPDGMDGSFLQSLGQAITFDNLGIDLVGLATLDPRRLKINYPSLSFNVDFPHVGLLGDALKLKFYKVDVDFAKALSLADFAPLDFGGALDFGQIDITKPKLVLFGKIDFGELPDLFAGALSGFSLDVGFAFNFQPQSAAPLGKPFLGIRGFGFNQLNLNLLSFVELSIDSLSLGPRSWTQPKPVTGSSLEVGGARLTVIGHPILDTAAGAFFSLHGGGGDGFWLFMAPSQSLQSDFWVVFDWGIVGKNIDFDPTVAQLILTPPDDQSPIPTDQKIRQLGDTLKDYWDPPSGGHASPAKIWPAGLGGPSGWTFAASFGVLRFDQDDSFFEGRVLVQHGGYAGLAMWGELLNEWFGYKFVFVGIYRKDVTPGQDYYYISTTIPGMTFGDVRFTGGEIAVEVFTGGSFMVDLGFPWPGQGGGRQWDRTFGAIMTPGQASGGMYFRKQTLPAAAGAGYLAIAAGFAVQWGLGTAFDEGIIKGWVRVGVYGVIEGEAWLDRGSQQLVYLCVTGAGGILLEGYGELDWWIISIRIGVIASAEISLDLLMDHRTAASPGTVIDVRADLFVSAYASACIGGGCFRLCRSIHVTIDIPAKYQLHLG